MKIKTSRFGEIEVDQEKLLEFSEGIIGFNDLKKFLLIGKKERMVMWLQSVERPEVAFIVVNPFLFEPGYDPKISQQDLDSLEIKSPEDINILTIVVVPENPKEMTANLLGPIVMNTKTRKGKQVILQEGNYSVKHPVVKAGIKLNSRQMVS